MRKKDLFFLFFVLLFFSIFLISCNLDPVARGVDKTDKVTITKTTKYGISETTQSPYRSNVGAVVFSHQTHLDQGQKCIDCHHKHDNDARVKTCAKCHNGEAGYNIMHGKCLDCHIVNSGPVKCKQCH